MRCCRQHDQRIGTMLQKVGQTITHGKRGGIVASGRDIVRFVNNDDIPITFFQVCPVFSVLLECIDGDNGPVKVVERIVICGYAGTHPLYAHGIQARERYRESAPEFLLKLCEHALDREDQNTLSLAPADQFRK